MSDEFLQVDKAVISLSAVATAAMTAIGWIFNRNERRAVRQDERIAKLELEVAQKVSQTAHNEMLETIRAEIREQGKHTSELITQMHKRVDETFTIIAGKK